MPHCKISSATGFSGTCKTKLVVSSYELYAKNKMSLLKFESQDCINT